jgi:hypothetical protein
VSGDVGRAATDDQEVDLSLLAIPSRYRSLWVPFRTRAELHHLTTEAGLISIRRSGFVEPRDPAPHHWEGMVAVFLADPGDPLYEPSLPHVLRHVSARGEPVVRLVVRTGQQLYRSVDPERTFQVVCLERLPAAAIVRVERESGT